MKKTHLLFLVFLFQQIAHTQVITSDRRTDWSLAGYRDTIPVYPNVLNITNYGGVGNGVTVNNTAIQSAITALAGRSGTIYFPTGTYLFTASITLPDSVVLKGNSADSSKLSFNLSGTGDLIRIAGSISATRTSFTANATKDSTFFMVSNPSLFNIGDYLKISQNDSALLFSSWAYGSVGQIVQVKSIAGNRINITSPLRKNYVLSDSVKVRKMTPRHNIGIECLKILRLDASAGQTTNVDINYGVRCWLKGVELDSSNFAHIAISNSSNIEITGCYIHDAFAFGDGGQGYGIATQYCSGEVLIENNVFNHLRHAMLFQAGANGNVCGYNTNTNPYWVSGLLPSNSAGDMVMHGNYPYLNLFESNTGQNIVVDNSHGINGPYNTYFRNRADLYGIFMNTGPASDNQNFVGNEVTNSGFLMGLYTLAGNGQFAYANNIRGTIMPAGTTPLNDSTYYKKTKPPFFATNATWPSIGIPNVISSGTIPAKQRQLSGINFTDCTINYAVTLQNQYSTIAGNFCNGASYNFNGTIIANPGTYTDTIHLGGYDSIITLNLSVLPLDTTHLSDHICTGGTYDFHGQTLSATGTYTSVLSNMNGCDSLLILQLAVLPSDTTQLTDHICNGAVYDFHGQTLSAAGTYSALLNNINGCDSILVLQLAVFMKDSTQLVDSVCHGSTYSFNGLLLDSAGTYSSLQTNVNGCDSLVVLQLSVKTIDTTITLSNPTLTANEVNATYQWIDCSNDSAIAGATGQSFTPTQSGDYKVQITKYGCTDESPCMSIVITGIRESESIAFTIQPNPAKDFCTIYFNGSSKLSAAVFNVTGEKVMPLFTEEIRNRFSFSTQSLSSGIYFIKLSDNSGKTGLKKLVVQ